MTEYWTEESIKEELECINKNVDYDPFINAPMQVEFAEPGDVRFV